MLSEQDLATMRAVLDTTLDKMGAIQRKATVKNGRGGTSETWPTVATKPCRVAPTSNQPEEFTNGGRLVANSYWRISFPAGTDIRSEDRVVIDGVTYEVTAPLGPRSYEKLRRVWATVVK